MTFTKCCRWFPARLRTWLLTLILIGGCAVNAIIGLVPDIMRQQRYIYLLEGTAASLFLLFLWALVFSRLRWLICLPVVFAIGAAFALLRIEGVNGDLLPIFALRWSPKSHAVLAERGSDLESAARRVVVHLEPTQHDYPQFLGPGRDGVVRGIRLERDWSREPPRRLWKRPIGAGWSAFAVVGDFAFTQEQRGEEELVVCYSRASGEALWLHADRALYSEVLAGDGPRATPSVEGGRVYTVGSTGLLNCLDGTSGAKVWGRDILKDNDATNNQWGKSCSPLLVEGLVVVSAGGGDGKSLVAYRAASGEIAWRAGSDRSGYASPLLAVLDGTRQIVSFNKRSVTGHEVMDGRLLWQFPWPGENPCASQPVVVEGLGLKPRLLVSGGYGVGAALIEAACDGAGAWQAEALWRSRRLKAKFSNTVVRDGHAFGLDDGILACIDLEDGALKWKQGRYGHGQLLLVDDLLLVQAESGEVVLVAASPAGHEELSRFQAIDGKTWNHPALQGPFLLVRNAQEAACFELPLSPSR